jgi:transcription elongation GreA/GreB family factor
MSRAFVKEDDQAAGQGLLPDRPISPHPNLVTRRGLLLIERQVAEHRRHLAAATEAGDREATARESRELRYWAARHATAQPIEPSPGTETVVFGTRVVLAREDGTELAFRIVGEDEADPAQGRIAWTASPPASTRCWRSILCPSRPDGATARSRRSRSGYSESPAVTMRKIRVLPLVV